MCIGCRTVRPKQELIRVVQVEGEGVKIDLSGRVQGRGAYLCAVPNCWREALSKNRLEKALRTKVTDENKKELAKAAIKMHALRSWQAEAYESKDD
jgi:predicted RNA-binding protein YlxR (DUF448 family)